MPVRKASAVWNGTLKEGNGTMKMQSGAYEGKYSFGSRFEENPGTNPEELIAAAHAGCFSMALSGGLTKAGFTPERVETSAKAHLEKVGEGFKITRIQLACQATIPGIDDATFQEIAAGAKAGCPVSQALAGVDISLDAQLVS
ncbi:MAG: OsmC family protein [Thermoanaerobaculia bacterium]|jgi:osmotically inducible protein OsmC